MDRRLAAGALALGLACFIHPAAFGTATNETIKVQIRREAIASLLSAAVPYKVEVGASLLKESLTFTDPKDVSLGNGKATFAIRCQGSPFPVDQVLHPVFTFKRGASGYQLVVDSVPVTIPGFGKVDLKDFFPPVDFQSLLRQAVDLSGRPTLLEVKVERIDMTGESIDLFASFALSPIRSR